VDHKRVSSRPRTHFPPPKAPARAYTDEEWRQLSKAQKKRIKKKSKNRRASEHKHTHTHTHTGGSVDGGANQKKHSSTLEEQKALFDKGEYMNPRGGLNCFVVVETQTTGACVCSVV
jgi:hypothetical protein